MPLIATARRSAAVRHTAACCHYALLIFVTPLIADAALFRRYAADTRERTPPLRHYESAHAMRALPSDVAFTLARIVPATLMPARCLYTSAFFMI